ncbi:putative SUN domain-containing protein 2-like [Triplophysa rosa]|uniref:SUN domain-containing protein 2-like n=1 Tax=Triplophysa rosa TaxID=992332 RepID=A0A9W7WA47_TRIRA|nr:putative SUN domain-containing protein 2-like [Triplophysa rosa]
MLLLYLFEDAADAFSSLFSLKSKMLRRSSRLRLSGYYLPSDDGHDGFNWKISYRESPARKSWTHRGRSATPTLTPNCANELQTLYINDYSDDSVYDMESGCMLFFNNPLESEYQQQTSDLRSDVSNIREASDVLKQRLDAQNPLNTKDVTDIVQSALSLYKSDGTGMADYALESSGGRVTSTRCSETYPSKSSEFSLFGIPLWYYSESPQTVIQPEVHPGKCWAFRGSKGFLEISLSYPIRITHVTLEHIPKTLSPTGEIDSAPKDFVVYGLFNQCDGGQLLGSFTYNQDEDPIQTFKIPESTQVFNIVELRILSNWGHSEYTCVYRFRVHGVPWVINGLK